MEEEEPPKPVVVTTSAKPPKNKEVRGPSTAAPAPPPVLKSALKRPATASKGTSTPPVKPAVSAAADSEVATSAKPKKNKEVRGSSAAAASTPPPALKSALKRPATASVEDCGTAIKRAKTVEESDSKRAYFQRVWTEEDEIKMLQGIIDTNAATRKNPLDKDNINGYFDSVKKSFSFEPTKDQFTKKVGGLKKKYLNKKGPCTKDHDKEYMGLAKFIWGPGAFAFEPAVEPNTEEKSDWFESSYVVKSIVSHALDEDYVKQKWRSAPVEDKKRLEEMYKLLRAKEVEFVMFKTKFLNELVPMIFKSA
ncbi:unnamed protein product [Arabis nemorensis]|uniref:Uncharacterized protein n=1 Tax=Arabis nemorensis TaxID=586526 RepID=A0A565BKS4_9BRAS|nr:unnamed protein product [Arabis nemorensis]